MTEASRDDARKPTEKFSDGRVQVSIWENRGINGAFRAATFQLRYKDGNGDWQTGQNFNTSDLLHLEAAAKEARSRIEKWRQANRGKASPKAAA